jgi:DNA-binding IclR family transcriptional regulator
MRDWPPANVERLLGHALGSVGSVELLLLLRDAGDRPHTVEHLRQALGSPRSWTVRELEALADAGLARTDPEGWRYAPATEALAGAVDELARAWQLDGRAVSRWAFAARRTRPRRRAVR